MSNAESSGDGKAQEQVPDLYRLLGLTPLESDSTKIQRALLAMEKKVAAAQKTDMKLAQRAAKVVTLGKKNLLEADRKPAYDRAWTKAFGSAEPLAPEPLAPVPPKIAKPIEQAAETKAPELDWDLEELESYLPTEDPRSPFDLGRFLRYSASLPDSNPIKDYDKLQSFLGGNATATLAGPESSTATALMPEYAEAHSEEQHEADLHEHVTPKKSVPPLRVPADGIAKHIRRKRSRAMLLSLGGIVGVLALTFGILFLFVTRKPNPKLDNPQMAQANLDKSKSKVKNPKADPTFELADPVPVQASGLPKVSGLDGQSPPKPNMMEGMVPAGTPVQPAEPMPAPASIPDPAPTNTPPATAPMINEPAPPTPEPTPEPTPKPLPADPILSNAEKSAWNKAMKETLKTLGLQNFKTAKEQLTASQNLAKTQLQQDQHKRLATVAKLTEEYNGFLVDAIGSLGAAETFKVGGSSEVAFIEGNATTVSLKIRGRIETFALSDLQIGVANGLADLKMDVAHPNSLARKAAFALVHPKTNDLALQRAREQMAEAATAGVVEADMPTVFEEDYLLKK